MHKSKVRQTRKREDIMRNILLALLCGFVFWGCTSPPSQFEPSQELTSEKHALEPDTSTKPEPTREKVAEPKTEPVFEKLDAGPSERPDASERPDSSETLSPDTHEPKPEKRTFFDENYKNWGPPCVPQNPPKAEVCNGIDDDCDGDIDESCIKPECVHVDTFPKKNDQNHLTDILYLRFGPKGQYFYTSPVYPNETKVWDRKTGALLRTLESPILQRDILPGFDGKTLYSTNFSHNMLAWDVTKGRIKEASFEAHSRKYHTSLIGNLSLSRDGTMLAKMSQIDFEEPIGPRLHVSLWNTQTRKFSKLELGKVAPKGRKDLRDWVYLSNDAKKLYLKLPGQILRGYDLQTKKQLLLPVFPQVKPGREIFREALFPANNGKHLILIHTDFKYTPSYDVIDSFSEVYVYDIQTNKQLRMWKTHAGKGITGFVYYFAQTPDGTKLLTASDSEFKVWELSTGKLIHSINIAPDKARTADLSPDGKQLLTTFGSDTSGSKITLWDLVTQKPVYTINKGISLNRRIKYHSLSSDGSLLAILDEKQVSLWTVSPKKNFANIPTTDTTKVKLQSDGKQLALFKKDTIELWDVQSAKKLHTWTLKDLKQGHFHPNGKEFVAISSSLKGIYVWSLTTGKQLRVVHPNTRYEEVSNDLKTGLKGGDIVDLPTNKVISTHSIGPAYSIRYDLAPNGRTLGIEMKEPIGRKRIIFVTRRFEELFFFRSGPIGLDGYMADYAPWIRRFGTHSRMVLVQYENLEQLYTTTYPSKKIDWLPGSHYPPLSTSFRGDLVATTSAERNTVRVWRCLPPPP